MQLTFGSGNLTEVEVYTDSDMFAHASRAISWRLKLQECTLSTTEAEYIVVFDVAKEAI